MGCSFQVQGRTALASSTAGAKHPIVVMKTKLFDPAIIRDPQEAVEFLVNILEASTEYAIIGKDLDGNILLWNEGARCLYGYAPEEVIGKASTSILRTHDEVPAGKHREILKSALRNGKWEGTVTRVRQNGQRLTTRTTVTPRHDAEGAPIGFLFISKDISDEVRAEKALRRARDKLTGLYNRRYLLELLQQALLAARRYQLPLCVMMLDVDHFKRINDTYGHLLGDHALATLGRLIRENLRANDIAGRYGSEEFCIALTHTSPGP